MFRITAFAGALLCLLVVPASAQRFHPECNISFPCVGAPPTWGYTAKPARTAREHRLARRGADLEQRMPIGRAIYSGGLVDRARAYMGGNPTGWRSLWCGKFMSMIAPDAAKRVRNPNAARDWARLPHVSPQVGAIAVLKRGKGGHVGVVSGFDARGNPIIVSGNHGKRVGEGVYPASRVLAYVSPS